MKNKLSLCQKYVTSNLRIISLYEDSALFLKNSFRSLRNNLELKLFYFTKMFFSSLINQRNKLILFIFLINTIIVIRTGKKMKLKT